MCRRSFVNTYSRGVYNQPQTSNIPRNESSPSRHLLSRTCKTVMDPTAIRFTYNKTETKATPWRHFNTGKQRHQFARQAPFWTVKNDIVSTPENVMRGYVVSTLKQWFRLHKSWFIPDNWLEHHHYSFITGPPNRPVSFGTLSSVGVVCNVVGLRADRPAAERVDVQRAGDRARGRSSGRHCTAGQYGRSR